MPLRRTKDLGEYTIAATNTDIGKICDFYFDDKQWTIRYIVVDTGLILPGRKVLLSPLALLHPCWSPLHLRVNLTSEQINSSPSIDVHKPISGQHEAEHQKHYGWPAYWEGDGLWGSWPNPRELARASAESARKRTKLKSGKKTASNDAHLRSVNEVTGYHINARDGEIGHLEDFLFDDETWEIRYAVVDTKNWWPGKRILLRPEWIERVSWAEREIYTKLSRGSIQKSPEWDPDKPFSREYELKLHKHYGYAPDWTSERRSAKIPSKK